MDVQCIEVHIDTHIKIIAVLLPFLRCKDGRVLSRAVLAFFCGAFFQCVFYQKIHISSPCL